jgi:hypothetical protein
MEYIMDMIHLKKLNKKWSFKQKKAKEALRKIEQMEKRRINSSKNKTKTDRVRTKKKLNWKHN